MIQHPYNSPVEMNVPTAAQQSGDFTNPGVPTGVYNPANGGGTYPAAYIMPCNTNDGWQGCSTADSPWGGYGSGTPPNLKQYFDPNGAAISGLNPQQTRRLTPPMAGTTIGYPAALPVDRWEATGKVTYAFNDNNKIWGSYTTQIETDSHPLSIWWAPEWTIPYPGKPVGKETAHVYLANFTHVFSATTTNEFVFSYAEVHQRHRSRIRRLVSPATARIPEPERFRQGRRTEIPDFTGGWSSGVSPKSAKFSFNSGIYGKEQLWQDGQGSRHHRQLHQDRQDPLDQGRLLLGYQGERPVDRSVHDPNGMFDVENWGASSTYNMTLDRLMGRNQNYNEQSTIPIADAQWHQWSIWGQDSWKATPKLTINLGLRADHEGQWYDKLGGAQVWEQSDYVNTANPPANTGLIGTVRVPPRAAGYRLQSSDFRLGKPRCSPTIHAWVLHTTSSEQARRLCAAASEPIVIRSPKTTAATPWAVRWVVTRSTHPAITGSMATTSQTTRSAMVRDAGSHDVSRLPPLTIRPARETPSRPTNRATTRCPMRTPGASAWRRRCLPTLSSRHRMWAAAATISMMNGGNGHIDDATQLPYGAFFTPDPKTGELNNISPPQLRTIGGELDAQPRPARIQMTGAR